MDIKLKADIAESAVVTQLLKREFRVLKPIGDRLPYDLAIEIEGRLLRIQVKSAWYDQKADCYIVDARRTKTNRRQILRERYSSKDFDFVILYLEDKNVFYVMPVQKFLDYGSTISLVEADKRRRRPRSSNFREHWALLSEWAPLPETAKEKPVKFGEAVDLVTPSQALQLN